MRDKNNNRQTTHSKLFRQGRSAAEIGGMKRRSSLEMTEAQLGDLFGRRFSGFSDLDVLSRRGSLESTTAVLDAAIMDLTRRRLSIAGGGAPSIPGGSRDSFLGAMNDPLASVGNMNSSGALGVFDVGSRNSLGFNNLATQSPTSQNTVATIFNHQNQLQDQQRELELRQRELEVQRQQIVTSMEERRRTMQEMQQKMQLPPGMQFQSKSLSSIGGRPGLLMGLQNSNMRNLGINPGLAALQQHHNAGQPYLKGFSNLEDALQHEMLLLNMPAGNEGRRNSIGTKRRGSLELLMSTLDRDLARHANQQGSPSSSLHLNNESQRRDSGLGLDLKSWPSSYNTGSASNGQFATIEKPLPLAMEADKDWLTPLHCFVRQHCVEAFTATQDDMATPAKGKRRRIQIGQVGIRCPHCHHNESPTDREHGSVYYPKAIASVYNATMNLLQRHLHKCTSVPSEIMRRYEALKKDDARSGTSKKYWIESALSLGLVDTPKGIRFSPLNSSLLPSLSKVSVKMDLHPQNPVGELGINEKKTNFLETRYTLRQSAPLVTTDDEPYATAFSFFLLSQMQPCVFTEADRLGKRKGLPPGFPGLACRHCFGGYGSGRFFPSSIKTLSDTSKTLNVLHNHMMRCRKCPPEVRETLDKLRKHHDQQRAKMKFGSQKAFFARIWDRLHYKDSTVNSKRKFEPNRVAEPSQNTSALGVTAQLHQGGVVDSSISRCEGRPDKRQKLS